MNWLILFYVAGALLTVRLVIVHIVTQYQKAMLTCKECSRRTDGKAAKGHIEPWKFTDWTPLEQILCFVGPLLWLPLLMFLFIKRILFPFGFTTKFERQQERMRTQARHIEVQDAVIDRLQTEILALHALVGIPFPLAGRDEPAPTEKVSAS